MRSNILVRLFGFPGTLLHGDTLVLDRWLWLKRKFSKEPNHHSVLDVGCGSGAFTIGLSRMGFKTLGLTWADQDAIVARKRAALSKANTCTFEVYDVRKLNERTDLHHVFDYAVCTENIEHILNDQKLMNDISECLKPGGKLFLTTPNINFIPMSKEDLDPLETTENGAHVRRGYSKSDLEVLCKESGFQVVEIDYVSGFISQKLTGMLRRLNNFIPMLGYVLTFPFRFLPPLFDRFIPYTGYSITLVAIKL